MDNPKTTLRRYASHRGDEEIIRKAALAVFSAYDGCGYQWKLTDTDQLWKIHFGVSAGVVGVAVDGQRVCVKLFYDDRLKARIRNRLKKSKAGLAYRKGLVLLKYGISCPELLGYAENQNGMGLVVSELAENYEQVDTWIKQQGASSSLISAVGLFIRDMHDSGVSHKDLSPRNIMMRQKDAEEEFDFLLLDYEDSSIHPEIREPRRRDELHHFYERIYKLVSSEQLQAFVAAYAGDDAAGWIQVMEKMVKERPSKYTRA